MEQRYKTLNIYPKDYDRLTRMANGMPLGRVVSLMLDRLERQGMRIVEIGELPCPDDCQPVPVVTVDVAGAND